MTRVCSRLGCSARASKVPVLVLWPAGCYGAGVEPVRSTVNLPVCDAHAVTTKLADILTDEGWLMLVDTIARAGLVEPDRDRTELTFTSLTLAPFAPPGGRVH